MDGDKGHGQIENVDMESLQPSFLCDDACFRADDVLYLEEAVPDGYVGTLCGKYNPSTGVHYAWSNSLDGGTPVALVTETRDDGSVGDFHLHGYYEQGKLRFRERMDEAGWKPLRIERFCARHSLHSRNDGLGIAIGAIEKKHVVIVGCGSVGSQIAELLARAGIRRFTLIDADVVEYHNLSRAFDISLLGKYKTEAVARRLHLIAPGIEVVRYKWMLEQITDYAFYDSLVPGDSIILGCADSRSADASANQLCAKAGIPFLSCGFWPCAAVCENFIYRPDSGDQLYGNVFSEAIRRGAVAEHYANYTTANDGIKVIQPGLAASIAVGNALSAQLALDLLMESEAGYISRLVGHMPSQYLLFCNTPDEQLAGTDAAALFHKPLECICPRIVTNT